MVIFEKNLADFFTSKRLKQWLMHKNGTFLPSKGDSAWNKR